MHLACTIASNGALFIRQDTVEAAWAVVDPVLNEHPGVLSYPRQSWGPEEADQLIAKHGRWHNPAPVQRQAN